MHNLEFCNRNCLIKLNRNKKTVNLRLRCNQLIEKKNWGWENDWQTSLLVQMRNPTSFFLVAPSKSVNILCFFYKRYLQTQNVIKYLYCKFLQHKKSRTKIFDEILLKVKKLKLNRGRENIVYRNFCTYTLALSHNSSKGNGKPLFKHKQSAAITNSKACSIASQGRNTIKINKKERNWNTVEVIKRCKPCFYFKVHE